MRPRSAIRAVRIDSDSSVGLSDATMLSGSEFKLPVAEPERRGRVKVCPGGRGVGVCRRADDTAAPRRRTGRSEAGFRASVSAALRRVRSTEDISVQVRGTMIGLCYLSPWQFRGPDPEAAAARSVTLGVMVVTVTAGHEFRPPGLRLAAAA